MLFNSYIFLFAFLPIVLGVFTVLQRWNNTRIMTAWLVMASVFFYGWWNPYYLILLGGSIGVNFWLGTELSKRPSHTLFTAGVLFNIGVLGYFKYAAFFANITGLGTLDIILPLAISFFTFQQIAYLADSYKGKAAEYNFLDYCLFVTFFPQLIAGPIVHHKDMMPQFANKQIFGINIENLSIGATLLAIGLFKKVVIADQMAEFSTPVFNAADSGGVVYLVEAWLAALSYTFQLYFDFSGYSDMALGLARLFGIQLPLNFFSPYKSASIIDFWRRWHMTLSRFLRDYLYIPLGGNRKGRFRRHQNIMITMLLGGLWHGAGWNFIIWGGLHGLFIVVNYGWRALCTQYNIHPFRNRIGHIIAIALTFTTVMIAWVFFRATTTDGALSILGAMAGLNGLSLDQQPSSAITGLINDLHIETVYLGILPIINMDIIRIIMFILPVFFIVFFMPNTAQFMRNTLRFPAIHDYNILATSSTHPRFLNFIWSPNLTYSVAIGIIALVAFLSLTRINEFLYYQF